MHLSSIFAWAAVAAAVVSQPVQAQPGVSVRLQGTWPEVYRSPAQVVAVAGSWAYVLLDAPSLVVYDVTDPAHPVRHGEAELDGWPRDAVVAGGFCYVAAGSGGLQVVEVRDPDQPVRVGTWSSPGYAVGVAVAQDKVYLADENEGLHVLSVLDPAAPVRLGGYNTAGSATDVCLTGQYAVVADDDGGVAVLNVAVPTNVVLAASVETGTAEQVALLGNHLLVADSDTGLRVYNLANPAAPAYVTNCPVLSYAERVVASGSFAYATGYDDSPVITFDLSDPAHPRAVWTNSVPSWAEHVALANGRLWLAEGDFGVEMLDLSDPARPARVGTIETSGDAAAVALAGRYAYLADGTGGLRVFDLAGGTNPLEVARLSLGDDLRALALQDRWLYVSGLGNSYVFDVSNPTLPALVSTSWKFAWQNRLLASGHLLYGLGLGGGVSVTDIGDPARPQTAAMIELSGWPQGLALAGSRGYLARNGLETLDWTDPLAPIPVSVFPTRTSPFAVAVAGNRAFLASGEEGLQIFDVRQPANPIRIGAYRGAAQVLDVTLAGDLAILATGEGVEVVDVSQPGYPLCLSRQELPAWTTGVSLTGHQLIALGGYGGFAVLRLETPGAPVLLRQPVDCTVEPGGLAGLEAAWASALPTVCQWHKGATALPAATNVTLVIRDAGAADAGDYWLAVTNAAGWAVSSNASLRVLTGSAPVWRQQPLSQSVQETGWVEFWAYAAGTPPIHYQWRLNGTNLPGANDGVLTLSSVGPAQAGSYSLLASNAWGWTLSSIASLTVWRLADAVDAPALAWTTGATGEGEPWSVMTNLTHDGVDAVGTGAVWDGEESWLETTVSGPGLLTFWWKVSSAYGDVLNLVIDGQVDSTLEGERNWRQQQNYLPAGPHTIRWSYLKDDSGWAGQDMGWVDQVTFQRTDREPIISQQPSSPTVAFGQSVTLSITVTGAPPFAFQWFRGPTSLPGATNRTLYFNAATTNESGVYSVVVSNAFGLTTSSIAALTVGVPQAPLITESFHTYFCWTGTNLSFTPSVSGTAPLSFQWLLEGTNLPGKTASWLPLDNLGETNSGLYTLVSSNAWGLASVPVASVQVVTPASLGEALDAPELPWTAWSDSQSKFVFHPRTNTTADGVDAARGWFSPDYSGGYSTYLKTVVVGPGRFSFWWKCSVYTNYAKGEFTTNAVQAATPITGEVGWREQVVNLGPGTNTLQWRYYQYFPTGASNPAANAVWVDRVCFVPAVGGPTIVLQPEPATAETGGQAAFSVTVVSSNSYGYQWFHDTQPLAGATNALLVLSNLIAADAGSYAVLVSNAWGQAASSNALLTVRAPAAPRITQQPQGRLALEGREVVLQGAAEGSLPLRYQWRRDGLDLAGATNSTLVLPRFTPAQAGAYSLVVSNQLGGALSSNALVTVLSLGEAVEAPHLTWTTGGWTNWAVTDTNASDGTDAVQSMRVNGYGQDSWLETTVTGPGVLSFWWKVSSYQNSTFLTFQIDASEAARISGQPAWARSAWTLGPGSHTLRWWYYQSYFDGYNCGWLDRVEFTPSGPVPGILTPPVSQLAGPGGWTRFSVTAFATEAFSYQWRFENGDLPGETNATLTLTNLGTNQLGAYSVVVSNAAGWAVSSNAFLTFGTLAEALDTTNLTWTTGGDAPWFAQSATNFDGAEAAQSGRIADLQETWLETTVYGPGSLSFRWRVQSDGFDRVQFLINGTTNATLQGDTGWGYRGVSLAAGAQVLRWRYSKDSSGSSGADSAWLDAVVWEPTATPPSLSLAPTSLTLETGDNATFTATATGSYPLFFQWRLNGVNLPSATGPVLTLIDLALAQAGQYSIVVSNAYGSRTNSASLTVRPPSVPMVNVPPVGGVIESRETFLFTAEIEGSVPVAWQWLHNGLAIPGATSNRWFIAAATPAATGEYAVVVSNRFGATRSIPATLTVQELRSPQILTNPASVTALEGGQAEFAVRAAGTPPLTYQWLWRGEPFAGGTGAELTLSALTPAHAGAWSVRVSNDFGAITSAVATLTLIDLGQAVNAPHLSWTNSGHLPWFVITNDTRDGSYAAQSGPIGHNQQSWIETQVEGPGVLSFWSRALSETNADLFEFRTNGVVVSATRMSGSTDWTRHEVLLSGPTTLLRWSYAKNGSSVQNEDCARLDQVVFTPIGPAPIILTQPQSTTANSADEVVLTVQAVATEAFACQWRWGGLLLEGETNATLRLPNVTTNHAGLYSVLVSNLHGTILSSNAQLVVRPPVPPSILMPPQNVSVLEGQTATLSLVVTGTPPFAFQWYFDGVLLPEATNLSLTLSNVTLANAGSYFVRVTSPFGATNSPAGRVAILSLAEALDTTGLTWTSGGSGGATWFPQSATSHDGTDAARSGAIGHSSETWIETSVAGPGTLTFWWSVSSERNYDYLEFRLNNVLQSGRISGTVAWQQQNYPLAAGPNLLRWRYSKDGSAIGGSDCAWLDEIVFTPAATAPTLTAVPVSQVVLGGTTVTLTATASGTAPLAWQWFQNNTLLPGRTDPTLTLNPVNRSHSGQYVVVVTNLAGAATSQPPAQLRVLTRQRLALPARGGTGLRLSFGDEDGTPFDPAASPAFEVWASTNLAGADWVRLTNALLPWNGQLYLDDPDTTPRQKFYRVLER